MRVSKGLMETKVTELKEELGARDEPPVSGGGMNKAWLRDGARRLHARGDRDSCATTSRRGRQRGALFDVRAVTFNRQHGFDF